MNSEKQHRCKVMFQLTRDADDYPPADWEHLWAFQRAGGVYEIDNIPFFVRDVAAGDEVLATQSSGSLVFDRVVKASGHSTLRVIMVDLSQKDNVRQYLRSLGCETEASHLPSLFAVDVPPDVTYETVREFLSKEEDQGVLEYEEAAIRHS